jgi:hypothetical protein
MRVLLTSVLLSSLAFAQEQAPEKVVSGAFGIDFASGYFFRGIQQENQGIIAQPWIELGYSLYEGGESLRSLGLTFGLWNSLHDGPTGTGGNTGMWYESDFYVTLSGLVGERLSLGTTFTAYHSPNNRFGTVEELAFSAKYDDRGQLLESFESGLQPSLVIAVELDGQADAGTHVGIYAQLGVEPTFSLGQMGSLDLTLALPVTLGISLRDYYELAGDDDLFGFFDVGAVVSSPLTFLPSRMGPWNAELGLHWLLLGDNTETINDGDTTELIASFGLSTKF